MPAIENCRQCCLPFEKTAVGVLLCSDCIQLERQEYRKLYVEFARHFAQLDMRVIAGHLGTQETLLTDVLNYRLAKDGEGSFPRGARKGYCSLCQQWLLNRESPEIVCIGCLRKVQLALASDRACLRHPLSKPIQEAGRQAKLAGAPATVQPPVATGAEALCQVCGHRQPEVPLKGGVCSHCYQSTVAELNHYKRLLGQFNQSQGKTAHAVSEAIAAEKSIPLPPGVLSGKPPSELQMEAVQALQHHQGTALGEEDFVFLKLLELDEHLVDANALPEPLIESPDDSLASHQEPQRHYGFKRQHH
jgi:hypothetical protein